METVETVAEDLVTGISMTSHIITEQNAMRRNVVSLSARFTAVQMP